jgi:hypothetical protein
MNPLDFPNIDQLIDTVRVRDTGVLLIVMIVATGAGLLANSRFIAPRFLPYVRAGLAGVYFASFTLLFVIVALELIP